MAETLSGYSSIIAENITRNNALFMALREEEILCKIKELRKELSDLRKRRKYNEMALQRERDEWGE